MSRFTSRRIRRKLRRRTSGRKAARNIGRSNARKAFIQWIKRNNPKLYRAALLRVKNSGGSLNGMDGWFDSLTSSLTDLAPKYLQYKQQKKVMKMQMTRAEKGLPPANVADYAPVIKTRVDIAPETRRELISAGQKSLKDMMLPIGLGVGGLVLVLALTRKGK